MRVVRVWCCVVLRAVVFVVVGWGGVECGGGIVVCLVCCVLCCVTRRFERTLGDVFDAYTPPLPPTHKDTHTHTTTHTTQPEGTDERCDVRDLVGPEKKRKRQSSSNDVKRH